MFGAPWVVGDRPREVDLDNARGLHHAPAYSDQGDQSSRGPSLDTLDCLGPVAQRGWGWGYFTGPQRGGGAIHG